MPGAGGLKVVKHMYNVAPRDGTNFGIFARGAALFALRGSERQASDRATSDEP